MPRKPYNEQKWHAGDVWGEGYQRGCYCIDWGVMVPGWESPCHHHGCPECGHQMHYGAEVGCCAPDWLTGFCECTHGWLWTRANPTKPLLHKGRKP